MLVGGKVLDASAVAAWTSGGLAIQSLGRLDPQDATAVEELLAHTGTFDVMAAWVVHVCRQRAWPALSTDPGCLHRIDRDLSVDLL